MSDIVELLKEPDAHYHGNFDTPKRANAMLSCLCQEAAEEIESLRREVDRLKSENNKLCLNFISISGQAFDAWADSAASQSREQQLREYLHRLACLGNGAHYGTSDGNRIAQVALALQQDTTALQSLIAKAGEVMREAAQNACTSRSIGTDHDDFDEWDYCNYGCADAIRALPAITLDDLK